MVAATVTVVQSVRARSLAAAGRLDVDFFLSGGAAVQERLLLMRAAGVAVEPLNVVADVSAPARFKREWAEPGELGIPYLRPYDVFDYAPVPAGFLSLRRSDNIEDLRVRPGTLLQTCSGRNLGPSVFVDDELASFALSHDLVRIDVSNADSRYYLHAYLLTATAQALLRQGMSGSVIDHLTPQHVETIPVPLLSSRTTRSIAAQTKTALDQFATARQTLSRLRTEVGSHAPAAVRPSRSSKGWTLKSKGLNSSRLDVAYNDPLLDTVRSNLRATGGISLDQIASCWLPPRYKRFYVEPPHGRPILSGRQILQYRLVNLRNVSDRSFDDPKSMEIAAGMTLIGGVGRAEGRIGEAGIVCPDRDGWLASNDVMRIVPRPGVSPGVVYLALSSPAVQQQIAALPYGSVVDHIYPADLEQIVVPTIDEHHGRNAYEAAQALSSAVRTLDAVVAQLDIELADTG